MCGCRLSANFWTILYIEQHLCYDKYRFKDTFRMIRAHIQSLECDSRYCYISYVSQRWPHQRLAQIRGGTLKFPEKFFFIFLFFGIFQAGFYVFIPNSFEIPQKCSPLSETHLSILCCRSKHFLTHLLWSLEASLSFSSSQPPRRKRFLLRFLFIIDFWLVPLLQSINKSLKGTSGE